MRSVKDSFDSDVELLPEITSKDVVAKNQKKKASARGDTIPKEFSGGFKKASELLRDAEVARLAFGVETDSKDDSRLRDSSKVEREVKQNARSEVKAKVSRARKKKGSPILDADKKESLVEHTSCYFPKGDAIASPAQFRDTVLETEYIVGQAQDLLKDDGVDKDRESIVDRKENRKLPTSKLIPGIDNDTSMSIKVHNKHMSIEAENNRLTATNPLPATTSSTSVSPVKPTIDLTIEYNTSLMEDDQDSISKIASIAEKYSYRAQDLATDFSYRPIELNPDLRIAQPTISNPSLDRPELHKTVSPVKRSPVKKKQLTMTERALEDFRPEGTGDSLPLQEYFPVVSPKQKTDKTKRTAKSRAKTTGKSRKPEKRSSLLAPTDAIQSLYDQQLMFGTSSQLMQHSSSPIHPQNNATQDPIPTLSRDDSFVDIDSFPSNMLGLKSTRSLWSAATRDGDGTLMDAEAIEALNTPGNLAIAHGSATVTTELRTVSKLQVQKSVAEEEPMPVISAPLNLPEELPAIIKSIPVLPRSLGEAATKQRETSKPPIKKKRRIAKNQIVKPEDAFKKVATIDLKEELKSFGRKPPRSRAKMVELLLECRANQNKFQEADMDVSAGEPVPELQPLIPVPTSTEPQDKFGANLNTVTTTIPVPESSQPKRKRPQLGSATSDSSSDNLPPPSFQVPKEEEDHEELDQIELDALMTGIHQAVLTQPPTHSITNPSWKEKIAMYDPIVLEELTAWLNTGGLDAVGIDTEVWPALVRDWCESKSICFIWTTEGWRKKRG